MKFFKMHGIGNDFLMFDARREGVFAYLNEENIKKICDRRFGLGCDQLLIIEKAPNHQSDIKMNIYNSDGSRSSTCGNATRCVADFIMKEQNLSNIKILSDYAILNCYKDKNDGEITVDMGEVQTNSEQIPTLCDDTSKIVINDEISGLFGNGFAVGIGNPHIVFFIDNIDDIDIIKYGSFIENHKLFPKKINVEFAKVIDKNNIKLRVWERGSGETLACGSGACATAFAGFSKRLTNEKVHIHLPGGILTISYDTATNHILMKGATTFVASGFIEKDFLL